jgi:hypothetical protein
VTAPAAVWLAVGVASTMAIAAVLIALVRHVFLLGRTLRRFQEEVGTVATDISTESQRAASRTARLPRGEAPGGGPS